MLKLAFSRLWQGLIVLLIVSMLTFALLAAAGGDAVSAMDSNPLVKQETFERLRSIYGLDQPLYVRYGRWLANVIVRGDLGSSFYYHTPVLGIIVPRLFNTLLLVAVALFISWSFAFALGSWAARRRGSWIDRLSGVIILLTASTPRLVLALVALAITARTSFFVVSSASPVAEWSMSGLLARTILPPLALSVPLVALFLAQAREGFGAALAEDFVLVARAKGLPERVVLLRHALRAALNPLITIFGYSLGTSISGSVVVETILSWHGLGHLSVLAVRSRDVPLLMGVVLITSTAVLAGNWLADILQRVNDPRLRSVDSAVTNKNRSALPATTISPSA